VIITGNVSLVLRFKALVQSISIVAMMGDPIAFGIVASLARPDGNITGIGLNRFAVVTRGKFWCHHLIFLQS
jgi:putative ABC transport system substrate-binding protein